MCSDAHLASRFDRVVRSQRRPLLTVMEAEPCKPFEVEVRASEKRFH